MQQHINNVIQFLIKVICDYSNVTNDSVHCSLRSHFNEALAMVMNNGIFNSLSVISLMNDILQWIATLACNYEKQSNHLNFVLFIPFDWPFERGCTQSIIQS